MKKLFHILRGWGKSLGILSVSTAEQKLSKLRLRSCSVCDHHKYSEMLMVIRGDIEGVNVLSCSLCHCPCKEKSLVIDEECPAGKW